jgi:hypothetical protein
MVYRSLYCVRNLPFSRARNDATLMSVSSSRRLLTNYGTNNAAPFVIAQTRVTNDLDRNRLDETRTQRRVLTPSPTRPLLLLENYLVSDCHLRNSFDGWESSTLIWTDTNTLRNVNIFNFKPDVRSYGSLYFLLCPL